MRTQAAGLISIAAAAAFAGSTGRAGAAEGPPPSSFDYLQYGVAIAAETVISAGDVCPESATAPCIFGSGGGMAVRVGYRSSTQWYVGGAYEASRHDPANLLRLAILQQLRGEFRYYIDPELRASPYVSGGLGMALYGNEWGTDTGGLTTFLGVGVEFELSRTTVVGGAIAYRSFLFRGWTDSAGQRRADEYLGFGLAHVLALEVVLEVRDPLPRW